MELSNARGCMSKISKAILGLLAVGVVVGVPTVGILFSQNVLLILFALCLIMGLMWAMYKKKLCLKCKEDQVVQDEDKNKNVDKNQDEVNPESDPDLEMVESGEAIKLLEIPNTKSDVAES